MEREIETRRTVYDEYKGLGKAKEGGGFVEVTEWTNASGVDIYIDNGHTQERISMDYLVFDQVKALVDILVNDDNE